MRRILLYYASSGRSALGAVALQNLGSANVAHLDDDLKGWREQGQPGEAVPSAS